MLTIMELLGWGAVIVGSVIATGALLAVLGSGWAGDDDV